MDKNDQIAGAFVVVLTIIFTLITPGKDGENGFWNYASSFVGWVYFFAWSVSFYSQCILNHQRKNCLGLATDFLLYNLLGFTCYSFYTVYFFADPIVRKEYSHEHEGAEKLVSLADVVFAVHAFVLTAILVIQTFYFGYEHEPISRACKVFFAIILPFIALTAISSTKLQFLDFLGDVKLLVTLIKYTPQIYMNYQNKSTEGFSIQAIILDFVGGSFSISQLFIDAAISGRVGELLSNPVKLGLGSISMFFDICFIFQRYVLYPIRNGQETETESDIQEASPLLQA